MAQKILDIKIKGIDEAASSMDRLSASINKQREEQKQLAEQKKVLEKRLSTNQKALEKLNQEYADGTISQKEYEAAVNAVEISNENATKALVQNTSAQAVNKAALADLNKEHKQAARLVNAEADTLDELRRKLALAQTAYGKLDQSTEEGRKAAAKFAAEISKLNEEVKDQEKAIGDNRRNVGNYGDALKGVTPMLGSFGSKIEMMTSGLSSVTEGLKSATEGLSNIGGQAGTAGKQVGGIKGAFSAITSGIASATRAALAFIATPIGAAIAALAAIGAATKAFIDYNAEVQKTNALISGLTNESGELVDQIRVQSGVMSDVLGVEQKELVEGAKVLVQQFGISYPEALEKMQAAILATNGTNEEFMQSIKEYSTFFAGAGYSVEEFADIVNAGFDLGIYSDKLPDAIKEADISLREMTSTTRDALVNAFGPEFAQEIADGVNSGAITTRQALEMMSEEAGKVVQKNGEIGLSMEQAATLTADVFRGAGEDAGGALAVFDAINVSLEKQTSQLDEQGLRMQAEIERQQEVAEARDRAFNSESVQSFMKALKDIGAFLQKVWFVTVEAFAMTIDLSIIKPIQFVVKQFNNLKEAASSALAPLKSISDALGMTSKETDNASKSTSDFVQKLKQQKQAQAQANAETERAAVVLEEAKERAAEYVEELRGIAKEQERQPLLMQAEDMFSEESAEDVNRMLRSVARQIEENANITVVTYRDMTLTVEEFAQLSQDRLNDIQKAEEDAERASHRRSEDRRKAREKDAQEEAKRLAEIAALARTAEEQIAFDYEQRLIDLELFGVDEKDLTEQQLAAKRALQQDYQDKLDEIDEQARQDRLAAETKFQQDIKEAFDKELKLQQDLQDKLALQDKIAMNNEIQAVIGNEEEIARIKERYRKKSIQDEIDATTKMIEDISAKLSEDATMQDMGIDLLSDEQTAEYQKQIEALMGQLSDLNLEYAEVNYVDGSPQSIGDLFGLSEEGAARAQIAFEGFQNTMSAISQITQQQAANQLRDLELAREKGAISEEQYVKRRQQIERKAAKQSHRINMTNAAVDVAQGVLKAYMAGVGSAPFPFNIPLAKLSAGIAAAFGAVQLGIMQAKKPKFAKGGILKGPSHAQGGIQMFGSGGYFGEAEGGEIILTKGVAKSPALASMASAINVAGGGTPIFQNGGVLNPITPASPTDRAADLIAASSAGKQPVLVVEQLQERQESMSVIESLRTIG